MDDESETRRLRKEVSSLQSYIEDQRRRYSADVKALRTDLDEEARYSAKLRGELNAEYKHCEKLRKQLSDKSRLVKELREDLQDEQEYAAKLERKLEKRKESMRKLEWELEDLKYDYYEAYNALKRIKPLRLALEDTKIRNLFGKHKVSRLENEVRSLRSGSQSMTPPQILSQVSPSVPPIRPEISLLRDSTPDLESDYSQDDDDESEGTLSSEGVEDVTEVAQTSAGSRLQAERYPTPNEFQDEHPPEPTGDDSPGQRMRALAAHEGSVADDDFERAQEASESGNRELARQLKETGRRHRDAMKNYNRLAAAEIFNFHNPEYHSRRKSPEKIDLHHLFVREAEAFVEKHLELCRAAHMQRTEIIVGRGNHSADGVARIKPAIFDLLRGEHDVIIDEEETQANPGRIVIRFIGLDGGGEEVAYHIHTSPRSNESMDHIQHGMSSMRITGTPDSRRGLREATISSRA